MTQRHVVHLELVLCSSHWFHKTVQDLEILGSPDSQIPPAIWEIPFASSLWLRIYCNSKFPFKRWSSSSLNEKMMGVQMAGWQASRYPDIQASSAGASLEDLILFNSIIDVLSCPELCNFVPPVSLFDFLPLYFTQITMEISPLWCKTSTPPKISE